MFKKNLTCPLYPITLNFRDPKLEPRFDENRLKFLQVCSLLRTVLYLVALFCALIFGIEIWINIFKAEEDNQPCKTETYLLIISLGTVLEYLVSNYYKKFRTMPTFVIAISFVNYISFEEYSKIIPHPVFCVL